MSKFVKKKPLCVYLEVAGGQSDPECTHAILTLDEYSQLLRDIRQAEQEKRETFFKAQEDIKKIRQEVDRNLQKAAEDAAGVISSLESKLAAESRAATLQREINQNLIRICRERANADRKLRPKKGHTGYIVLESRMKPYRYRDSWDRTRWKEVDLWETKLQSPYSVQFSAKQVKDLIESDLKVNQAQAFLLKKLGIMAFYPGSYEALISLDKEKYSLKENIMFPWMYTANYRAGYWEISFLHTKPLGPVPAEMRPGN